MRVIATKEGHDGIVVRREGDEFDMPEGAKGTWFKPADEVEQPKAKRRKPEAEAPAPDSDVA